MTVFGRVIESFTIESYCVGADTAFEEIRVRAAINKTTPYLYDKEYLLMTEKYFICRNPRARLARVRGVKKEDVSVREDTNVISAWDVKKLMQGT